MAACAMYCATSMEITFCVSNSCERAVIENAPTSTSVATANTEKRMWDIEISSRHRQIQVNRDSPPVSGSRCMQIDNLQNASDDEPLGAAHIPLALVLIW